MSIKILRASFYLLFIFTPLLFTPYNNELFEFNKMLLTYGLTVLIVSAWLWRMVDSRQLIFKKTLLDIPLLLFLASQILSTFFSIDPHTSIWGYYSRLNGGLLSIVCYLLLYWAFVSNFDKDEALKMLRATIIGGLLVALWAIPEHFGYSPSCALLVGRWSADCWVQDVQSRVFATIGQPNWLAAYMGMLVFPAIYFFLSEKTVIKKVCYYLATLLFYLAFTFTFSRGGLLGVMGGIVFSSILILIKTYSGHLSRDTVLKPFGIVITSLIVINLLFGSALTGSFRILKENAPPPRPTLTTGGGGTQLENGGTESGQIRLIVWRGALDIFKHYPIFGSGVETFAYSYYMYRPIAHNMVSEWDFLYNKAHNEYLNYLANTGLVGFITYSLFIIGFILWSVLALFNKYLQVVSKKLTLRKSPVVTNSNEILLVTLMVGGYLSYLIQNFFGFSVVMIAILFYLFPAFVFVITESTKSVTKLPQKLNFLQIFGKVLDKSLTGSSDSPLRMSLFVKMIICLVCFYMVWGVFNLWRADVNYKLGSDASDNGSANKAYTALNRAYQLNPDEPLYQSDFGNVLASAAVAMADTAATDSAELKDQAVLFTENSLAISPANVSLWRTAIRTYYVLSILDKEYDKKTIEVIDKAISLAPTDPKLYYNKALILSQQNDLPKSIETMLKAIELKPNYREAKISLGDIYIKNNQSDKAIEILNQVLKAIPNDPDALKTLQEATQSAQN